MGADREGPDVTDIPPEPPTEADIEQEFGPLGAFDLIVDENGDPIEYVSLEDLLGT